MDLTGVGAVGYPSEGAADALLVLAHGAGAGQRHPFMVALAHGFSRRGTDVMTFDFPYLRQHRRLPDRAPVLEQAFLDAIEAAQQWSGAGRLFIGGKSMGGRIATHLGAGGLAGLRGMLVFGYPLHPPGKPEQLSTIHLPSISAPVFIVQGERDSFGTPQEFVPVLETMAAPVAMHLVQGGDHSLTVRGRRRDHVLDEVLDAATVWMRQQP